MTPRKKKIEVNTTIEGHYTEESPYGPWSKALIAMCEISERRRLAEEKGREEASSSQT